MKSRRGCCKKSRTKPLTVLIAIVWLGVAALPAQGELYYGLRARTVTNEDTRTDHLLTEIVRVDPETGMSDLLSASTAIASILSPLPAAQPEYMLVETADAAVYFHQFGGDLDLWSAHRVDTSERITTFAGAQLPTTAAVGDLQLVHRLHPFLYVLQEGPNRLVLDAQHSTSAPGSAPFHPLSWSAADSTVLSLSTAGIVRVDFLSGAEQSLILATDYLTMLPTTAREVISVVPMPEGGYVVHARAIDNATPHYYLAYISAAGAATVLREAVDTTPYSRRVVGGDGTGVYLATRAALSRIDYSTPDHEVTFVSLPTLSGGARMNHDASAVRYVDVESVNPAQTTVTFRVVTVPLSTWEPETVFVTLQRTSIGGLIEFLRGDGPELPVDGLLAYLPESDRLLCFAGASAETPEPVIEIDLETGDRTELSGASPPPYVAVAVGRVPVSPRAGQGGDQ